MRAVKFTVAYHLEAEVPDDWDDEAISFYIEENHCLDNHVETLHRRIEAHPGYCQTCPIGEAVVGHVAFEDLRALSRGNV